MKSVYRNSLTFLAFLCILKVCDLCMAVRVRRDLKSLVEGDDLHLSCEVLHCGLKWTGGWSFRNKNGTGFSLLGPSEQIVLSNHSSSINSTHLKVVIYRVTQSDAGLYMCVINWPNNAISNGHLIEVNVHAAAAGRNVFHRVLLCLGALTCFLFVLGLVWCLTRDHPPPVPPHSPTSFADKVKPRKEIVYAEVALNDLRRPNDHPKQAPQQTVYSSLRFS